MIKIKPVLVNVVVMYSLMLGGMALSCFDAIERGVHLSAVYNFLVWILGGTLCVICICHTYKIDEKGVRQLWLFIPKFTPWSAFTEVSIEPLFPDHPSDTRDRYVICLNRGVSRINQSSSAGTHLMRFLGWAADQAAELASFSLSLYPERRNSSIVRNGRCNCD